MSVKIYSRKLGEKDMIFLEKFLVQVEKELGELINDGWAIINSSIHEKQFIATLIK